MEKKIQAEQRVKYYTPIQEKNFHSRKVEITADFGMEIRIPGKEEPVMGRSLLSQNVQNPKPLEITIEEGELLQDTKDPKNLYLEEGRVLISGEKVFESLERFEKTRKVLEPLPQKDPDLTIIDGIPFRQTGTIQIEMKKATIRLEG